MTTPADPGPSAKEASAERHRPIARKNLPELVLERLRDMITEGHLAPGARIVESDLLAQLGVSRTPLREALRSLAAEELVDLTPSRGAFVRRFSQNEVADTLELIALLEAKAATLAVANATPADIDRLRGLHDTMMSYYRSGERLPYFKLNQAFHSAIVALSGNAAIIRCHGQLQSGLKRVRYVGHEGADGWAGAAGEHEEMIAALEARDEVMLAEVLRRHMAHTWDRVQSFI
ncbi:MAG: GntR family transcriptional regulator [Casimicrobiaceae bacterium]